MSVRKKQKIVVCLCVLGILLAAVGFACFWRITEGNVIERDGLRQNSRVYMTNVTYDDRSVCFTVVNRTCRTSFAGSSWPVVQKKEDGEWKEVILHCGTLEDKQTIEPFSTKVCRFWLLPEIEERSLLGEYRLINKGANETYAVGYFTITEDML